MQNTHESDNIILKTSFRFFFSELKILKIFFESKILSRIVLVGMMYL